MRLTDIEIDLKLVKLKFKSDELEKILADVLTEMRSITTGLGVDECEKLRTIMAKPSGTFAVTDIYPTFSRGNPEHEKLRRLRDAQFIRPAGGGRWHTESRIEIKPFGKMMWEKVGEQKLFTK